MVVRFIMSNVRGACQLFPNHMGTPNEETQHCKYKCTVWLSGLYVVPITIVSSAYTRCAFTDKALSGQKNTITTSSRNIFQLIGHVRFKKLASLMTILKLLSVRIMFIPVYKKSSFIILACTGQIITRSTYSLNWYSVHYWTCIDRPEEHMCHLHCALPNTEL